MDSDKDDVVLFERDGHRRPFLRRKVSLTVPICVLLIVIFLTSALIVTTISFYWTQGTVCYIPKTEKPDPDQSASKPVYYSRPKRSPAAPRKANVPCFSFDCCNSTLDPNAPWTQTRLPTTVYPIDYILTLDLFHLNEENDQYSGVVDIVLEVQSPTYDIILHGDGLLYSDVTVSQRSSPDSIQIPVYCIVPFPNTQTVIIHLANQLEIGSVYDVRISFFRALNVHGTGLFENQFNKDQFGFE
jgi:hypothetical protein